MKELVDQLRSERVELDASIKQFTEKSLGDDAAMAKLKTELSECRRQIHDLEEREKKKQDEIEVLVSEQQLLQVSPT